MEYQEEIVNKRDKSEDIRIICVSLATVHEGPKLVDLHQSENPQDRLESQRQIEKVEWQKAQTINIKCS